jgi:hypothetical protein
VIREELQKKVDAWLLKPEEPSIISVLQSKVDAWLSKPDKNVFFSGFFESELTLRDQQQQLAAIQRRQQPLSPFPHQQLGQMQQQMQHHFYRGELGSALGPFR